MLEKENVQKVPRLAPATYQSDSENLFMRPVGSHLSLSEWTYQVASDLLNVLESIHKLGLVHRDIRPANVVKYYRSILLVDWGFSTEINTTNLVSRAGVPYPFCLPEQEEAHEHFAVPSVDLYAWLVCISEVVSARLKYQDIESRVKLVMEIDWNAQKRNCEAEDYAGLKRFAKEVFDLLFI
jgi:serine/threonine protein kinase